MSADARHKALATQARRGYLDVLLKGIGQAGAVISETAQQLLLQGAEYAVMVARRDGVANWQKLGTAWQADFINLLRHGAAHGVSELRRPVGEAMDASGSNAFSLVDDDTIEREITGSRLALAMLDQASWEFTDLRTRMHELEQHDELPAMDLLRAHVVARLALDAWFRVGLGVSEWQMLKPTLHAELSHILAAAYHETNRWLISQGVLPEVDLRPYIRRSLTNPISQSGTSQSGPMSGAGAHEHSSGHGGHGGDGGDYRATQRHEAPVEEPSRQQRAAEEVLALLKRVVSRQVPGLDLGGPSPAAADAGGRRGSVPAGGAASSSGSGGGAASAPSGSASAAAAPVGPTPRLVAAIGHAQEAAQRPSLAAATGKAATPQRALEEVQARTQAFKQVLKQAADTPAERATIEIVALLFQSILMEERIPPAIRVWFARLQMPVLRVAVSEPDFFATIDHPARKLIDRMGSCVMGFSASSGAVGDALELEIKRIVQVVEAYPDTGRRVFQTVLTEFEKFLGHYFESENEATRKGVSLAQQVEQRETLAIQFTIELRKMLNAVPVQDGVREFLFHVWADVLAVTGMRSGAQSDAIKAMKGAAADLIWSASAKVSREERAEVIRRLPPLLKTLRDGMAQAGVPANKQDEHVRSLNNALAAAFTAKSAAIPRERLDELMHELQALETMLPETEGAELDETLVRDLSGHESEDLEVVAEGGSSPTPAMLSWAKELQVGSWYMLDYRGRNEVVQLAWRGKRHQLTLFVSPKGRGVLFQLHRLAAFLQAGLLLPAQDEALTVKATRNALAKLDADPGRLLN